MSQQINLVLPALRPRFNWLGLPVVAGAALAGLFLIIVLSTLGAAQVASLKAQEAELASQMTPIQQQLQAMAQSIAARRGGDATLEPQIAAARLGVAQRQEVLAVIAQGDVARSGAYSGLLQGFSRQSVAGVWLHAFRFVDKDIEIQGRLLDPALLPTYINRLNGETAFVGRHFAALDMKGVDPAEEKRDEAPAANKPKPSPRYTEFALRTELVAGQEKAR